MSPKYKGISVDLFGIPILAPRKGSKHQAKVPKSNYLRSFSSIFKKNTPRNLLIIYDIPEGKKKERDWFRRQLINLQFKMIQKSVWVGPSPLPGEFKRYIKIIGLKQNFKT